MNRRTALALLGASAASPLALGLPFRALAQTAAARTLTYGQSGAVKLEFAEARVFDPDAVYRKP